MKTISLLCTLFLLALYAQGRDFPILPPGNWIDLEYITFFPQASDTLNTNLWQAENVRKITLRIRVDKSTKNTTRWKIYLRHVYHNRTLLSKDNYREYFDSYCSETPLSANLIMEYEQEHLPDGEAIEIQIKDSLLRYTTRTIPTGLKNTTGLTQMEGSVEQRLTHWLRDTVIRALSQLTYSTPGILYVDSTHAVRVVNGSFPVIPNLSIRYFPLNPLSEDDKSVTIGNDERLLHTQPDSSYTLTAFLSSPEQIWLAKQPLHILPGDTLTIRETEKGIYTFEGKNADSYRFWQELRTHDEFFTINNYQSLFRLKTPQELNGQIEIGKNTYAGLLEKYAGTLHPYWKKSAELNIAYWEITLRIRNFLLAQRKEIPAENYTVDWEKAPFTQVNPFTDYMYQPENYDDFLQAYFQHKIQQLNQDNLTNKAWWEFNTDNYYLQKQLFSGYPRLFRLADNLRYTMEAHRLSYSRREYEDFISLCKDPGLLGNLTRSWKQYEKLEPGENIRNVGLSITDSLPLKRKADGYILLSDSYVFGDPQDFATNAEIRRILDELGVADKTTLCYFRPESRKQYLPDSLRGQHLYHFIADSLIDHDKEKLNLSPWTMILMKNDGTIISREISKTTYGIGQLATVFRQALQKNDSPKTFNRATVYSFLLGLFFCIGIAAAILYLRFGRIKRTRQLAELKLKALRSQMNPHFLFNALGSIQSLIVRENNDTANRYLTDFSKLLRDVLDSSEKQLVPLSGELSRIRLYLQLEQLRTPFETRITVDSSVDPELEEIPGMLLQPIVENAVIHGIVPQGGGKIEISIYKKENTLYCEIADNGKGFEIRPENSGRFGLRNTEERLRLLNKQYKASIGIVLKNRQDTEQQNGCRVIVSIPV